MILNLEKRPAKDKMPIIDHPTEFVGHCEDTGKLRCGLLTTLLDLQDMPFKGAINGSHITIIGSGGVSVDFRASEAVQAALAQGAQFWLGNLDGSEEAWLIELH
ncbi:hypothetical protein [Pseudomonas viridiflava]|uniref:hypothetical protein n=1 Tax=Pseudomonas viridiflava TaxID=33069 RepID=UPI001F147CE2|nr:hypothetical protein [Pseudomonas viridiflava]